MAFWSNLKPITRDLSDENMPIGDLSAQDAARNNFATAAKSAFANWRNGNVPREFVGSVVSDLLGSSAKSASSPSGGFNAAAAAEAPTVDYLNADLAKHYGMSAQTAYAEAMSNTAYQRAVKDMQAAGLNPALLVQSSYAQPAGNGYVSGQSGGRSYGTSAKSAADKSGLWQGLASLAAAGVVFAATKSTAGAAGAAVAAKALATVAGQAAKSIAKR